MLSLDVTAVEGQVETRVHVGGSLVYVANVEVRVTWRSGHWVSREFQVRLEYNRGQVHLRQSFVQRSSEAVRRVKDATQ